MGARGAEEERGQVGGRVEERERGIWTGRKEGKEGRREERREEGRDERTEERRTSFEEGQHHTTQQRQPPEQANLIIEQDSNQSPPCRPRLSLADTREPAKKAPYRAHLPPGRSQRGIRRIHILPR